jgi:hypothetical protein
MTEQSIYRDEMRPLARRGSTSTSVAAAYDAKPKAPAMIDRIWSIYQTGSFTPEEVHAILERSERCLLTSVRARICGLHKAGRLADSGERGLGESQKSKVVRWRRTTAEEYAAHLARKQAEASDD